MTLLEVMVVMAVVATLVVLAMPSAMQYVQGTRLWSATTAVKKQLIAAKVRAVANPKVHCGVYFDMSSDPHSTRLFFDDGGTDPPTANDLHDDVDTPYQLAQKLPQGVVLVLPDAGDGPILNDVVIFRGDGSAKNGGSIKVRLEGSNPVRERTVNVLASTGRVKVLQ